MSRRRLVPVVLAVSLLTAGTALAADQVRLRDQARDQACQEPIVDDAACLTAQVQVRTQTRNQVEESDEASAAVRTRTEEQVRTQAVGTGEPPCAQTDCLEAQVRRRERDRTAENADAPAATRERTEAQSCNEACLGDQGSDPAGPQGAIGPQAGEPMRLRAGESQGASSGGGK